MATSKYSDIEIQAAKNMLESGFKWLARNEGGKLFTHSAKPGKARKIWCSDGYISCVCGEFVPIFQNIKFEDVEPTSLENIVHPQILDDAERRYLSAVIRPFRNRVTEICKRGGERYEYLRFNGGFNWEKYFFLPNFAAGTMYKGMEPDHWYTLEELGL